MAKLIIEPGRSVDGYECTVCGNDEIELEECDLED